MRTLLAAGIAALALASCAPRRPAPAPVPPPPPAPAPAPAPPPPTVGWEDAPLTPGDWSYRDGRNEGSGQRAAFGSPAGPDFLVQCERNREISLVRPGAGGSSLLIRTTFGERRLQGVMLHHPDPVVATLDASDPLLDQMVFSRGRFVVEAEGAPRLILPAWPEPARVIEDCRG